MMLSIDAMASVGTSSLMGCLFGGARCARRPLIGLSGQSGLHRSLLTDYSAIVKSEDLYFTY